MSDEMDEYRIRIERQYADRRQKRERRSGKPRRSRPRPIEMDLVLDILFVTALGLALCLLK